MEGSGENWPHYQTDINANLEKAINYMSYLEGRVRELEKQNKTSAAETSGGYNNNNYDDGASSSCCETGGGGEWYEASLPEVKARVSENEVLIIIHCEKQKGIMHKIMSQLEALNLSVISSSVLPFGKFTLDITIVAQMGEEFNLTVSGIVKSLRRAISK
ncbi:transcription factor bHLH25-like [Neltuma alba]|uniref:transcription factor bHLH25-like n=1 Tax=Neltuma alba TaxID=207710 RepID=UPI0010A53053|nr:transcription factor bHLH25-like [Prosopis alba]XP_028779222.1 transcription factor bHLH25-like [Prosopis alba]XP_028782691.1 transcription factor bHLH25-like [Prosopis alba]